MTKQTLLALASCLCALSVVAWGFWDYRKTHPKERVVVHTHPTAAPLFFDDSIPPADPLIVGRWTNTANPQWHKVYLDDYDEEMHLYWGKEWDEAEDVLETDLLYHGNGWFRWKKQDGVLHEFATMDYRDVPIHHGYRILLSDADSLVYYDTYSESPDAAKKTRVTASKRSKKPTEIYRFAHE